MESVVGSDTRVSTDAYAHCVTLMQWSQTSKLTAPSNDTLCGTKAWATQAMIASEIERASRARG